jgi:hypothetical protein
MIDMMKIPPSGTSLQPLVSSMRIIYFEIIVMNVPPFSND